MRRSLFGSAHFFVRPTPSPQFSRDGNEKLTALALFLRAKAEANMEMDKTLKILLASLGVAGIAVLAIPNGDPLLKSSNAPVAAANPAAGQPVAGVQPTPAGTSAEAPKYVPPSSDQDKIGTADSATLQQENFGQPMFDPRPISEQKARPESQDNSYQPPQPQAVAAPQPQNQGGSNYYSPPPPVGYANGSAYDSGAQSNDQ
jgi:hypothetical protein